MKVVVLLGGASPERYVSYSSGIAVGKALRSAGHEVIFIDPAADKYDLSDSFLFEGLYKDGFFWDEHHPNHVRQLIRNIYYVKEELKPEVVFNALHGGYGEDGMIQDIMDRIGLVYTGSGAVSSKLAMNKAVAKKIMREHHIPTLDFICLKNQNFKTKDIVASLELPLIVKPNHGGSSVALSVVYKEADLAEAVQKAFEVDTEVLIEPFIKGREITVTVIGGTVYPTVEIRPKHDLYDYECKYTKGMSEYLVPAPIDAGVAKNIQDSALECYHGLGLEVYGRIDFLLNDKNEFFCLEANTLPGMTELSLVPKSVNHVGMNFQTLAEKIIHLSLQK